MRLWIFIIIAIYLPTKSFALYSDKELFLKTSEKCTRYFSYYETKYKIPGKLLQSVSLTESGRWHSDTKQMLPWPWAVNQGGRSFYFDTKEEAVMAVSEMIDSGLTNIDIGCMQVNLGYHSMSFESLVEAFEPKNNIAYGAELLKNHYGRFLNWKKAISAYHSMSSLGEQYYKRVNKMWKRDIVSEAKTIQKTPIRPTKVIKTNKLFRKTKNRSLPTKKQHRLRSSLVVQ